MAFPTETGGTGFATQLSDGNSNPGNTYGQSSTDLISFYNVTPIAQPTNSVDVVTALQNLGLFASGTFATAPITTAALTASSVSSLSSVSIANAGLTRINSSVAKTYFLNAPTAGVEKMLYVDVPSTAIVTVKLNSTEVASSLIILAITGSQSTLTTSSASSVGNILITNTTANTGGMVTLMGASSVEWVVKTIQSTLVTFTT